VIAINEGLIKDHLDKIVKTTVEETLNAMLDAEADQLCGAKRYEHSRTGSTPGLATTSASCTLRPAR
jgi:transposase-like protein